MKVWKRMDLARAFVAALSIIMAGCSNGEEAVLGSFLPNATIISGDPTCFDCNIDLNLLTDLGEARDRDVISGDLRSLLSTPDGLLATTTNPAPPMLFDRLDGRLLRYIGITGDSGAGTFLSASLLRTGPGDSVLVLDELTRKITVLSPYLVPVRTIPTPDGITDMIMVNDTDLLLVVPGVDRDSVLPFRKISLIDGSPLEAPRIVVPMLRNADENYSRRLIAPARDGMHFWSAHRLRYAIEKRTWDGELVQTLERDIGWFMPALRVDGVTIDRPPTAIVAGVWEDVRGLLWVHTVTADGRWPTALGQRQAVDGSYNYAVAGKDIYRDSRLEIIDPEQGTLVATAKFDMELPTFSPGPMLSRVLMGPGGWPVGEVMVGRLTGWSR